MFARPPADDPGMRVRVVAACLAPAVLGGLVVLLAPNAHAAWQPLLGLAAGLPLLIAFGGAIAGATDRGAWIAVALIPYSFLTYSTAIPSRHQRAMPCRARAGGKARSSWSQCQTRSLVVGSRRGYHAPSGAERPEGSAHMPTLEDTIEFQASTLNDLLDADAKAVALPSEGEGKYRSWAYLSTAAAGLLAILLVVALVTGRGKGGGGDALPSVSPASSNPGADPQLCGAPNWR